MKIKKSFLFVISSTLFITSQIFPQTMNITYNIPMFNQSGSFSVNLSSQSNAATNENEYAINILNNEGKVVKVIYEQTIDNVISIIKERTKKYQADKENNKLILASSEKIIAQLESLKMKLRSPKQLKNLFQKSSDLKSVTTSKNWNYTIQTIRNVAVPMNGNLNW